jgi:hypothetical protein
MARAVSLMPPEFQLRVAMRHCFPESVVMAERDYHPGDRVPTSGIYDVLHDNNHVEHHQVTCIKGYEFPPCRGCGEKVAFRLAKAALHLSEDGPLNPDGDPNEGVDAKSAKQKSGQVWDTLRELVHGVYRPGMPVPQSGIYDVIHDNNHQEPHQVTCVKDDKFPPCRGCTSKVRFEINTRAEHIKDDAHFVRG